MLSLVSHTPPLLSAIALLREASLPLPDTNQSSTRGHDKKILSGHASYNNLVNIPNLGKEQVVQFYQKNREAEALLSLERLH